MKALDKFFEIQFPYLSVSVPNFIPSYPYWTNIVRFTKQIATREVICGCGFYFFGVLWLCSFVTSGDGKSAVDQCTAVANSNKRKKIVSLLMASIFNAL